MKHGKSQTQPLPELLILRRKREQRVVTVVLGVGSAIQGEVILILSGRSRRGGRLQRGCRC